MDISPTFLLLLSMYDGMIPSYIMGPSGNCHVTYFTLYLLAFSDASAALPLPFTLHLSLHGLSTQHTYFRIIITPT